MDQYIQNRASSFHKSSIVIYILKVCEDPRGCPTTGVAMAPKTLSFEHPCSIVYPI